MAARVLLATFLATGAWWVLTSGTSGACIPVQLTDQRMARLAAEAADRIFVGTVLVSQKPDRDHHVRVFSVQEYVKGHGPHHLTFTDDPPCPVSVEEGGAYLIGAGRPVRLDTALETEARERVTLIERAVLARQSSLGSFSDSPLPDWATAAGMGGAIFVATGILIGIRLLAARRPGSLL